MDLVKKSNTRKKKVLLINHVALSSSSNSVSIQTVIINSCCDLVSIFSIAVALSSNKMVSFDRPIGAPGDAHELDYVCALHQTSHVVRKSGSIDAIDIQYIV